MSEEQKELQELQQQIELILEAAATDDLDTIYDHRATIVSMYAQAMAEFHFQEDQLSWLNELLGAVETNDMVACHQLLEQESDTDTRFLASQFMAVMAGFFHHDECLTLIQAIGLKALLEGMAEEE
ncbi:hypothetical protein [Desulfobulbus alkaliphilus]|uniref:hypothetical protein n=1 Tax=Desulfobulbus alkaliphilus TaxID=869814 RepID=UPI001965A25D|nr:hypothetical protein [Desulfobulbus alkaliphilus]MBM9536621.1 hypothetical protein [Desulfobulbus alkaliphilus]